MATPTPAPYQPTNNDDALNRLAQIVGSDLDTPVWTGDWHQALRDTATRYATTEQPQPAAAA
ncbi:hypothetical protein AB0933_32255 [Streptomyces venezuelae]|uniref:hypothetical protein n=1 Tax=Streptomyces venezuelae TaxID=54571 RepID=UPI003455844D